MTLRFLTTTLLAACVGATAFGQSLDRAIVSATAPLTDAQKSSLNGFLTKHAEAIKTGNDAAAADESRGAVVAVLRDPAATTQFRRAVATALAGELGAVVKGTDNRRAIVAMQVLRFTRSQEAIDLILERTSPSAERDAGKRIAAASLVSDAFEDLDASNTYVETIARRLRDACASESDPIALQQKLVAIAGSARRKRRDIQTRSGQASAAAGNSRPLSSTSLTSDQIFITRRGRAVINKHLFVFGSKSRYRLICSTKKS